ncbi:MAG: hypothetical protein ABJK39_07585 [Hyphomicrobiales bacterium]
MRKTFVSAFSAITFTKTYATLAFITMILAINGVDLGTQGKAYAQSLPSGTKVLPVPTSRPEDRSKPLPTFKRDTSDETNFPNEAATLNLRANIAGSNEALDKGMTWRVYSEKPGANGKLPLLGTYSGGNANFRVKAGYYLVHGAFGYAGQTKRVKVLPPTTSSTFEIKAGGLRLNAAFSEGDIIPSKYLRFEVARHEGDGLRTVANDLKANELVQFGEGNYHVTSHFGDINSQATAEVRVKAGKLTELTLYQRGAEISLKLVSESGGEALANTSWTVLTPGGDPVASTIPSSFPKLILAAGDYIAFALHEGKNHSKRFSIESGLHKDVEVILKP